MMEIKYFCQNCRTNLYEFSIRKKGKKVYCKKCGKEAMKVSKDKAVEKLCGKRPSGTALFEPHELGYACPICKAANEVDLQWSEYNSFIWCAKCNLDIPSCLARLYPEPCFEDTKPMDAKTRILVQKDLFLRSVEDAIKIERDKFESFLEGKKGEEK